MRMIDSEAFLKDNVVFADCEFDHPKYQNTLREIIDEQPTIDAIPVEWIKQKQSEIPRSSSWYVMMQFLMDLWKEEREGDHG